MYRRGERNVTCDSIIQVYSCKELALKRSLHLNAELQDNYEDFHSYVVVEYPVEHPAESV